MAYPEDRDYFVNKPTRSSGTSPYIQNYPKIGLKKEIGKLGIEQDPCYIHCNGDGALVILRPDAENTHWHTTHSLQKCPECGWLIGKRISPRA